MLRLKGPVCLTTAMKAIWLWMLTAGLAAGETYTLEKAVETALANSPDAQAATARLEAAGALLQQAEAAFHPRLTLETSYLRTNQPVSVFGLALNQRSFSPGLDFNNVPDADQFNARGWATLPLYAGGANVARRDAARAGVAASGHSEKATRQVLAYEVARTWLMVRRTHSLEDAAAAAVEAYRINAALAAKREKAGTVLKADRLDVEVRLAQAEEDLSQVRNANALARHSLRNLMGVERGEVAIMGGSGALKRPKRGSEPQRPELLAALEKERAVEAAIRGAKAGWKPQVSAFGSAEHNQGTVFEGQGGNYTVGLMAQWTVWDGRQTRGRVREAEAQLKAAREETRKLRLAMDLEVKQAELAVKDAEERLAVTERTIELAEESVKLTRDRFEQGLSLATQLIDAETALTAARVRRVEAETHLSVAIAAWRRALGMELISGDPE